MSETPLPSGDSTRFKVLIVEDNLVFRHHVAEALGKAPEVDIIAAVGKVETAIQHLEAAPDLVLLDLGLPDGSGLEVMAAVRAQLPKTKVLVITVFEDRATVLGTLKAGADGYVLKDMTADNLLDYVRSTLAGVTPISARAARHLLRLMDEPTQAPPAVEAPPPPLRPREKELLEHIATGLSQKEVARRMSLSPHTVAEYVQNIYRKLAVRSRGEAVYEALQHNLIDMPQPQSFQGKPVT